MSKFGREDTLTRITGAAEREQHRLFNACALREALLNAIIHNDYTAEVSPLVEIYSDRLSITSYGGLLTTLALRKVNQHLAQLRDWHLPLLMNGQVTVT